MKNWMMYVVECADGTLYTGITNNMERRLLEHNYGMRGAKYTRSRRPVKLVFSIGCDSHSEAAKKESAFKKLSRQKKQEIIGGKSW